MIKQNTPQKVQVSAFLLDIYKVKSSCDGYFVIIETNSNNEFWIKTIKKGTCGIENCIDISNVWLDWTPTKASDFIQHNVDSFIKQVDQLWKNHIASSKE